MEYIVQLNWDADAGVWIATSDDIPGLVLESGSFDALLERVRFAAPELLDLNQRKSNPCQFLRRGKGDHDIWYSPITRRSVTVDTKIKSRHTANAILKQSGIDYRFR